MKCLLAAGLFALGLLGCAAPEPQKAVAEAATPQKKCDEVTTGSNVKRCDRSGVSVITREELERGPSTIGIGGGRAAPQ